MRLTVYDRRRHFGSDSRSSTRFLFFLLSFFFSFFSFLDPPTFAMPVQFLLYIFLPFLSSFPPPLRRFSFFFVSDDDDHYQYSFFLQIISWPFFFIARFSLFSIGFLYHLLIWCRVVCIAVCLSFSCTARIQRANEKKTRKKHERKKIKAEAEKSFSFFFFLLHSKFKISTS